MTGRTVRTRRRTCAAGSICSDGEPSAIDFAGIPCTQSGMLIFCCICCKNKKEKRITKKSYKKLIFLLSKKHQNTESTELFFFSLFYLDATMYGKTAQPTSLDYNVRGSFIVYMKYSEVLNYNSNFQIDVFVNEDSLGLPSKKSILHMFIYIFLHTFYVSTKNAQSWRQNM